MSRVFPCHKFRAPRPSFSRFLDCHFGAWAIITFRSLLKDCLLASDCSWITRTVLIIESGQVALAIGISMYLYCSME
jgi:hypothetical protein